MADAAYIDYVKREWLQSQGRPSQLGEIARRALERRPRRVLDVGCGAGQELLPYADDAETFGVDVHPDAVETGRALYASERPGRPAPRFEVAAAEALPFPDGQFDLVLSRLALPYTDNKRALTEMARVLAPGGALVVKIHHLRYYLRQLGAAAPRGDVRALVHAARVIACGVFFELTGKQPAFRRGDREEREVFQLVTSMVRRLRSLGLRVVCVDDLDAPTPVIAAIKG